MQLDPGRLNYDLFLARWDQIIMYSIPQRIYTIELPSLARIYIYRRFATWCLRIKHEYHNTLYVPQCGIFSEAIIIYLSDTTVLLSSWDRLIKGNNGTTLAPQAWPAIDAATVLVVSVQWKHDGQRGRPRTFTVITGAIRVASQKNPAPRAFL